MLQASRLILILFDALALFLLFVYGWRHQRENSLDRPPQPLESIFLPLLRGEDASNLSIDVVPDFFVELPTLGYDVLDRLEDERQKTA